MREDQKLLSYRCLADAMARLAGLPWELVIAGAGPAEREVRQAFAPVEDRIRWAGVLAPESLKQLYRAVDLYLWPAVKEAFGIAFLEAQAAGVPVVAGRSGGVPGVVSDGRTGLLTPEGDAEAFAGAVRSLLEDPERRLAMGEAAMHRAARDHDIAQASALLDEQLRRIVVAA
jgi:glycosyltransferase involved in cell wall biosynthesis